MKLQLVAPFRSVFNLNTDLVNSHLLKTAEVLANAAEEFSNSSGYETSCPISKEDTGFRKFTTLTFDHKSLFSTPALRITLSSQQLKDLYKRSSDNAQRSLNADVFAQAPATITSSSIDIFDNTVSILNVSACVTDVQSYLTFDKTALDATLTEICSQAAKIINIELIPKLVSCVANAQHQSRGWSGRDKLTLVPSSVSSFDDVSFPNYPKWPSELDPLLWASRSIFTESSDKPYLQSILRWGRLPEIDISELIEMESFSVAQFGTNIFFNNAAAEDFIEANRGMQYFTTLFDVLNDSQSRMYTKLSEKLSGAEFNNAVSASIQTSSFIDYVLNEFNDYIFGLQAERKRYANDLFEKFDMEVQIRNLKGRRDTVRAKIDKLLLQRDRFVQRGMEAALIAIGAIALVDFGLTISVISRTQNRVVEDGVYGILDIAKTIPTDSILVVLLALVTAFSVYYAYRKR